jgi:hypothetical protein
MANTGDFRENGWIYRDNCLEQVGVVACAVASKKIRGTWYGTSGGFKKLWIVFLLWGKGKVKF